MCIIKTERLVNFFAERKLSIKSFGPVVMVVKRSDPVQHISLTSRHRAKRMKICDHKGIKKVFNKVI